MKIARGFYGNRQSGELKYQYYVPNNAREGQKFRVEAYNKKANRVIQTMWTIGSTPVVQKGGSGAGEKYSKEQLARVDAETGQTNVEFRRVLDTNTLALPGGKKYGQIAKDRGLSDKQAKALWSLSSNINYDEKSGNAEGWVNKSIMRERLLGLNPKKDNSEAVKRILGG